MIRKQSGEALLDKINRRSYSKKKIAINYTHDNRLQKPEEVILHKIKDEVREKAILDIGVGGGRTILYLKEISRNYIGIDYSPAMVEICKRLYPDVEIICCDARDMSIFEDNQFDLVNFSFNGIDSVPHTDRLSILKEIFRILKPDRYFVFSSHNRDYTGFNQFRFCKLSFNPFESFRALIGLYNHIKYNKLEIHTEKYSIINDSGHNYSLMHYYIGIIEQIEQLIGIGFRGPFDAYDLDGNALPNEYRNTSSCWLYYCLRK